jgi:hypothetical protein
VQVIYSLMEDENETSVSIKCEEYLNQLSSYALAPDKFRKAVKSWTVSSFFASRRTKLNSSQCKLNYRRLIVI